MGPRGGVFARRGRAPGDLPFGARQDGVVGKSAGRAGPRERERRRERRRRRDGGRVRRRENVGKRERRLRVGVRVARVVPGRRAHGGVHGAVRGVVLRRDDRGTERELAGRGGDRRDADGRRRGGGSFAGGEGRLGERRGVAGVAGVAGDAVDAGTAASRARVALQLHGGARPADAPGAPCEDSAGPPRAAHAPGAVRAGGVLQQGTQTGHRRLRGPRVAEQDGARLGRPGAEAPGRVASVGRAARRRRTRGRRRRGRPAGRPGRFGSRAGAGDVGVVGARRRRRRRRGGA
mmetsp:Transcript_13910/g.59510  ORF Transcript_13910/g.59510 Transcript_13910/m.59510 type:complete len:291 (-) Transcript_13910:236-1108(-)